MVTACTTTGVIIVMVFFVSIMSRIYVMQNIPQQIITVMKGISGGNKTLILLMVNLFLVIQGMLMDDFSGTLMAAPLLFPLMKDIGVHPVHFAAIMGTNLGMGNMTVPMAPILYLGCRIGGVTIDKVMVPSTMFLIFGSLPVVLITTYFPDLSLFLPRLILGIK
jgi:TRAP-type C4-dicarboxylate transport system permease large subunit